MTSGTGVRDFTDYSNQPWPGKIFPLMFNDIADAGDGFGGLQYVMKVWIKDYLHSGGIETGLNMFNKYIYGSANITGFEEISANTGVFQSLKGFSDIDIEDDLNFKNSSNIKNLAQITGTNAKITTATITTANISDANVNAGNLTVGTRTLTDSEWQQLTNIGSTVISASQWAYLGNMDQPIASGDNLTFVQITGDYLWITTSNGLKIGTKTPSSTQWGYLTTMNQNVATTSSPTFGGLTMNGNIAMGADDITFTAGGTVDGVDVGSHTHGGGGQGGTVSHSSLSNRDGDTSYLHSTSAEQASWNTAASHPSTDGSSHTYINQSVTSSASPTFGGMNLNGNLVMGSNNITFNAGATVDGVDVSTLNSVVSDLSSLQSAISGYEAIGSANKRWINCPYVGAPTVTEVHPYIYYEISAADPTLYFEIPLPYIKNGKNLVITRTKIGIDDADTNNKVTYLSLYGWTDYDTNDMITGYLKDLTTTQEYIWDHNDITLGGSYERVLIDMGTSVTTDWQLRISYCQVEYYYA